MFSVISDHVKNILKNAQNLSEIKPFLLLTDWPRYPRLLPSKNRDGLFRRRRKNLPAVEVVWNLAATHCIASPLMFTRGKVAIKVHITPVKLVLRHQHRYRLRNEAGDSKASSWIIPKNVECPVPEGSSLLLGAKLRGEGSEIGVGRTTLGSSWDKLISLILTLPIP